MNLINAEISAITKIPYKLADNTICLVERLSRSMPIFQLRNHKAFSVSSMKFSDRDFAKNCSVTRRYADVFKLEIYEYPEVEEGGGHTQGVVFIPEL